MVKRFIYLLWYKIPQVFQSLKVSWKETHIKWKELGVYTKLKDDIFTVLLNGVLLWIALIPFFGYSQPWYAISYGVLAFWITEYISYLRTEFTK